MIIKKSLRKRRLNQELDKIIIKIMARIEYYITEQNKSAEDICKEWGISENVFLGAKPTLHQFLKLCFILEIRPHDIIQNVYANHEVTLR